MNKLVSIAVVSIAILTACTNWPNPQVVIFDSRNNIDSILIITTIQSFYIWYDHFVTAGAKDFDFTDKTGEHLKLKRDVLENYLNEFRQSGYVSEEFIANERKFYEAAEKLWQNEALDEVPSGMDADKMFCAQDWDAAEFTTAPVSTQIKGDRATAKLMFPANSPNGEPRTFELKKEKGNWLLTKVVCVMGVVVK